MHGTSQVECCNLILSCWRGQTNTTASAKDCDSRDDNNHYHHHHKDNEREMTIRVTMLSRPESLKLSLLRRRETRQLLSDHRVYENEGEKIEKYKDLKREIGKLWVIRHLEVTRVSDKIASRRLQLAGHCFRHPKFSAQPLVLWEPSHRHRGRGRPRATFIDTLK